MIFFCFSKINNMVRCNRVDGNPCLCDLVEPVIQGFIREVSVLMMKLICGTITNNEKQRMRSLLRRPNSRAYIELYIIHSDLVNVVHRI